MRLGSLILSPLRTVTASQEEVEDEQNGKGDEEPSTVSPCGQCCPLCENKVQNTGGRQGFQSTHQSGDNDGDDDDTDDCKHFFNSFHFLIRL